MTGANQLSNREIEILQLVATGASNKEIAKQLTISVNTVKVHLRNIYGKLGVSTRTEATIYAVREGFVTSLGPTQEPENALPVGGESVSKDKSTPRIWGKKKQMLVAVVLLIMIFLVAGILGVQRKRYRTAVVPTPMNVQTFEQDRWKQLAPMITPKAGFASVVFDNVIYVIGGETGSGITSTVERYDVSLNLWESVAGIPVPLTNIQAATVGGKIFVPGGQLGNGEVSDQLLAYDPRTDTWGSFSPMPLPLSAYALTAFEGKLYLFGGWDGKNYTDTVLRYDPSLDVWDEIASMPTTRGFAGASVSGESIHVIGGFAGEHALDVHEVYVPGADGKTEWEILSPLPVNRYRFASVSVAEIIHLIGGTGTVEQNQSSYKYFPQDDQWHPFSIPLTGDWADLGSAVMGERIYVFGGRLDNQLTDKLYSYQAVYSVMIPVLP